ncbi:MAG TPA: hypothetical protein PLO78_04535 [Candidatus Omnitrophota bacterium]|nr:hypothetical protein [Candidatus Omnitrophota bacterium]
MKKKPAVRSPYSTSEWTKINKLASEKGKIFLAPKAALKKIREEDVLKDFKEFKRKRAKRQLPR